MVHLMPADAPPAGGGGSARPAGSWGRWGRWALRIVPGLVALVVGARVLGGRRTELAGAATAVGHLRPGWLVVAVLAECGSLVAYAALQQRLLTSAGVRLGIRPAVGITLAGYAIQNSLPGGPAWSAVFAFREFRRRGADSLQAGWSLVAASLLSAVALATLGLVGVILAQRQAAALNVVEVVVGVALVTALVVGAVHQGLTTSRGVAAGTWILRRWQGVARRPPGDAGVIVRAASERLRAVRPRRAEWAGAAGFALGNWAFDCACLALAFAAVRSNVPWRGLLLAYGTAQLAANLPITPGGLGVVEGSLSIALVLYGGAEASTVAAVLLYRMISFWAVLPVGWGSWAALRWIGRRARPLVEEPAS